MFGTKTKFFFGIQIFSDIGAIIASIYLTFWIRIELNPLFLKKFNFDIVFRLIPPIYLIVIIFLFSINYFGLYKFAKRENFLDVISSIIKSVTLAIMILVFISFIFRIENYSRSLIFLLWAVSIIPLCLSHGLGIKILKWSKAKGFAVEKIAIVGLDTNTKRIQESIESLKNSTYEFIGYIQSRRDVRQGEPENKSALLGKLEDITNIINDHMIDRIIVSDSSLNQQELYYLVHICEKMNVYLDQIPDLLSFASKRISLTEIDGIPLIGIKKVEFAHWDQIIKRTFDLFMSLIAILFLSPLFILISILIKIDSKGSVFFKQKRIGRGGKSFFFIKFRSMVKDAEMKREVLSDANETNGVLFKIKNDPRVTRIGKFIRKFSIDELPSLWNVLIGEMSLVGPRPLPYSDLKKESESSNHRFWAEKRAEVLPGITGLWQIGGRSKLEFEEMVKLEIYYVESWSLLLDLKIILKTIPVVLSGEGSY